MTGRFPTEVLRQLTDEAIVWLATVRRDGQPQVVPVWFLWDGQHVLVYSLPRSQKVRNIAQNPRVSLHFNSDPWAEHVTRFDGRATIVPDAPPATDNPAYLAKYRDGIADLDMTPEQFAREYRTLIRIELDRLIHW
ncbi:MAG: TIGR03667 family PPOX class F420-dependent oxidoreductase [Thermomicrobium sp.]|nr:TIGR03667 family PPOX class F420-dependent oxidoreductase [Thermomicrobium sp.]MDW8060883.1 TIGR03667 family PPOX class F420-dependent oxidoreductase [Thermomicrobium sp.]